MNLKEIISHKLSNVPLFQSYLGKRSDDIGYDKLVKNNKAKCRLTFEEKKEIKALWGKIIPYPLSIGYSFYEMVKSITDFSVNYLPSAYYMPYVFNALNNKSGLRVLGHKGLQKILFKECNQPETIICKISGILYDSEYRKISYQEAHGLLKSCNSDMIYKPAIDSSMGHGVKLINPNNIPNELLMSPFDFIIQKKVNQSAFMSALNASSVNCIRFTSININNHVSVESHIIKIGAKGSVVDNIGGGSGGLVVGISSEGMLGCEGYRIDCTRVKSGEGIDFMGKKIPNFQAAVDMVTELHSQRSSMGIIGWDVAFAEDNQPILIEANTYWPGITMEQLASGPIFGNRTDEVIDFIIHNSTSIRHKSGGGNSLYIN